MGDGLFYLHTFQCESFDVEMQRIGCFGAPRENAYAQPFIRLYRYVYRQCDLLRAFDGPLVLAQVGSRIEIVPFRCGDAVSDFSRQGERYLSYDDALFQTFDKKFDVTATLFVDVGRPCAFLYRNTRSLFHQAF